MRSAIAYQLVQNVQAFLSVEFGEPLDFGSFGKGSRKASGKKPNCTPGKSWSCGFTCLPMSKKRCGSPLPGQPATYADYLSKQAVQATTTAAPTSKPASTKKTGAIEMTDDGIPSRTPKSMGEIKDFVRKWQKDRGYDKDPPDVFFDMHDSNHALAYLAAGRSPASIQKDFGPPGKAYSGQPQTAEEAYVLVAENTFLKGSSKALVVEEVYNSFYRGGGINSSTLTDAERKFYSDPARRKDIETMYDEIANAPQDVKDLLAKNSSRLKRVRDNGDGDKYTDEYSDKTLKRKYKDAFADFSETPEADLVRRLREAGLDDDAIARKLTRIQYSLDNIAGKRQYLDEIYSEKVKLVEDLANAKNS